MTGRYFPPTSTYGICLHFLIAPRWTISTKLSRFHVDGGLLLLMVQKSGVHQIEVGVDYPILYKVLNISGGCLGFLPSTECSIEPSHEVSSNYPQICKTCFSLRMRDPISRHWTGSSCSPRLRNPKDPDMS